jgi:hypothetical protein
VALSLEMVIDYSPKSIKMARGMLEKQTRLYGFRILKTLKLTPSQVLVAHACNPSYSGGRDQEDRGLKPA